MCSDQARGWSGVGRVGVGVGVAILPTDRARFFNKPNKQHNNLIKYDIFRAERKNMQTPYIVSGFVVLPTKFFVMGAC